jgi:hypothetical protein
MAITQGILVENMRREGFELGVCPPKVLFKRDESGQKLEPIEEVVVEVTPCQSCSGCCVLPECLVFALHASKHARLYTRHASRYMYMHEQINSGELGAPFSDTILLHVAFFWSYTKASQKNIHRTV